MELALENNIQNNMELSKEQNFFLDNMLGQTIDRGLDIGIRCLLPDYIEDTIIDLKDNIINLGFKDGISKSIEKAIDTGKSLIGIFSGNFENVNQVNEAIKRGGIIDSVSEVLDNIFDKLNRSGKVNSKVMDIIQIGKDSILNSIENNIESKLSNQILISTDLDDAINKWKQYYNNQDFNNMDKEYSQIKSELKDLIPLENTLNEARNIEILHNLIKNNGKSFNLNEEQKDLLNKLSLVK